MKQNSTLVKITLLIFAAKQYKQEVIIDMDIIIYSNYAE